MSQEVKEMCVQGERNDTWSGKHDYSPREKEDK